MTDFFCHFFLFLWIILPIFVLLIEGKIEFFDKKIKLFKNKNI